AEDGIRFLNVAGVQTCAFRSRIRPFVFEWGRKCDTVVPVGKNRRRLCARRSRDVAQFGSALDWGSRGRGFKSRRPDTEAAVQRGVHHSVGPFLCLRCRSSRVVHPLSFGPAFLMIVCSSRRTLCRAGGVPVRVQNTRLWSCHSSAAERRDRWVLTDRRSITEGTGAGMGGSSAPAGGGAIARSWTHGSSASSWATESRRTPLSPWGPSTPTVNRRAETAA